jgi:hypothetical protein
MRTGAVLLVALCASAALADPADTTARALSWPPGKMPIRTSQRERLRQPNVAFGCDRTPSRLLTAVGVCVLAPRPMRGVGDDADLARSSPRLLV